MAMGWKNGVTPALCNGERCLDKSWLCPLTHLPCSGAAASVFQARMGGRCLCASLVKPIWDRQGELGNPDFLAETNEHS